MVLSPRSCRGDTYGEVDGDVLERRVVDCHEELMTERLKHVAVIKSPHRRVHTAYPPDVSLLSSLQDQMRSAIC